MNNKSENTSGAFLTKVSAVLKTLKIDPDKPVTFVQQLAVMCVVLFVSCLLFTVVYIFQAVRYGGEANAAQTTLSEESSATQQQSSAAAAPAGQSSQQEKQSSEKSGAGKTPGKGTACSELFDSMTTVTKSADDIHNGALILVNKDYSCRTDGENVESLMSVKTGSYLVSDATVSLDSSIVENVNDFFDDFASIYGDTDVMVACGYRSYSTQVGLFNQEIYNKGEREAENWVAPPGYSEHQTGYAFDLDLNISGQSGIKYDGEGVYSWLNENCGNYGFTLRYRSGKESVTGYSYEPWHFRYVGLPHSVYMEDNNLVFEEYIEMLRSYTVDNALVLTDNNGGGWCVYYVPGEQFGDTSVPVPEGYDYTISGDNVSGFIVTVKKY